MQRPWKSRTENHRSLLQVNRRINNSGMMNVAYFQMAERPSFPTIQLAAHRSSRTRSPQTRRLSEKDH